MRKLVIIGALAASSLASSAMARDNGLYVGVEGGVLKPENTDLDFESNGVEFDDAFVVDYKFGYDVDAIAGYDFGAFRAEAELGYKRAKLDEVRDQANIFATALDPNSDGRANVISAMGNVLTDFGDEDGAAGYLGGGVGVAKTRLRADFSGAGVPAGSQFRGTDSNFAWQLIAGLRFPVSENVEVGAKYRFFSTKFDFADDNDAGIAQALDGRFRSHSLLASLIFNFGAAVPPPPPPPPPPPVAAPPPPATQTCPDGSVILATDRCPLPPAPPPPPPPAPERG